MFTKSQVVLTDLSKHWLMSSSHGSSKSSWFSAF